MSWGSLLSSCEPGCPCSVTEDSRDFGGTLPDSRNRISPGCEPSVCRQSLCLSPVLSLSPQRKQDPSRHPGRPSSISPRLAVPGLGDVTFVPFAWGCVPGTRCTCWAPWRVALESGGELCDCSISLPSSGEHPANHRSPYRSPHRKPPRQLHRTPRSRCPGPHEWAGL